MKHPTTAGCGHLHDGRARQCERCYQEARAAAAEKRLRARFWSKVNKRGPIPAHEPELGACWVWRASVDRRGYGQFARKLPDLRRTMAKAHRVAYELTHGLVARGQVFCHRCDNPACVRPSHVYLGTHADNGRDRVRRGHTTREYRRCGICGTQGHSRSTCPTAAQHRKPRAK